MALSNEQYQRLMRFIDADMNMDEMEAFENELDANPEMLQQLDFELSVRNTFQLKNGNEEQGINTKAATGVKKKIYIKWKFAAAAAACSLLVLSTVLLLNKKKPDNTVVKRIDTLQQPKKDTLNITQTPVTNNELPVAVNTDSLFKKYYSKEPAPDEYPIILADAFENYKRGNYSAFENLDMSDIQTRGDANERETILLLGNFYKGISELEKNNNARAVNYFNQVLINTKDVVWKEKAIWYLGLSYLKANNKNAEIEFNKLIAAQKYSRKAKEILKHLNTN